MTSDQYSNAPIIFNGNILYYRDCLRALCRTKLLPVTHVLVDTWILTVMPVYKLQNVFDDLKWSTWYHLHSLLRHNWQHLWFWKTFFAPSFLPVRHPSTRISTRPQRFLPIQMTGLCIKLWNTCWMDPLTFVGVTNILPACVFKLWQVHL